MNWQLEKTIFKLQDEYGDIQVKEQGLIRSLYFGNDNKQSSMLIPEPSVLVLNYTQAMMSSLLFVQKPGRVLVLGLGGGSLCHFFNNFFVDCFVDVVELRQSVIDIATLFFKLPNASKKIVIYHDDAREFVSKKVNAGCQYDLILIDAFDQWGPSHIVGEDLFLLQCKMLVGQKGICCFNLWNRPEDGYGYAIKRFRQIFSEGLLELCFGKCNSNVVLFGLGQPVNGRLLKNVTPTAEKFRLHYGIDFPHYLRMLQIQNTSLLKRLERVVFAH